MARGLEGRRVIHWHQQLEGETVLSRAMPAWALELPSSGSKYAPEATFTLDLFLLCQGPEDVEQATLKQW